MAKLYNLARMTTATVGAGTITLGSATSGFLTFSGAGVADGDVVSYGIRDGVNSEVGTGTYTAAGTTLSRTVTKSTNSNTAISLSGSAEVYVTVRAEDLQGDPTSWTPVLTAATPGNLAVTYSVQAGRYIKTGKLVVASFNIQTSAFTWTTASGSILITGLPFAANSTSGYVALGAGATNGWNHAGYTNLAFQVAAGASQLTMEVSGPGIGEGPDAISSFASGGTVWLKGTVSYFTD